MYFNRVVTHHSRFHFRLYGIGVFSTSLKTLTHSVPCRVFTEANSLVISNSALRFQINKTWAALVTSVNSSRIKLIYFLDLILLTKSWILWAAVLAKRPIVLNNFSLDTFLWLLHSNTINSPSVNGSPCSAYKGVIWRLTSVAPSFSFFILWRNSAMLRYFQIKFLVFLTVACLWGKPYDECLYW